MSIASIFVSYRAAHEHGFIPLCAAGVARASGIIDDDEFWRRAGPRLTVPAVEMDSATTHHLYSDLIAERFPHALFVLTIRDVRSWVTSYLDLVLRGRVGAERGRPTHPEWQRTYLRHFTGSADLANAGTDADDREAVVPLMRAWARHMRQAASLPPDRTLVLRTHEIREEVGALARLVRVPVETLRVDLAHMNRAPLSLDRMAAYDGTVIREAYEEHCADLMAEYFPVQHRQWTSRPVEPLPKSAWALHLGRTRDEVSRVVAAVTTPMR